MENDQHLPFDSSSSEFVPVEEKAASVPIAVAPLLVQQTSAPSYLNSLKENDAPPFRRPQLEPRPRVLVGTIMTKEDAVAMIAAADENSVYGLKKFLGKFLVEKKVLANYSISEKNFLVSLMMETIEYAAQRDFCAHKLACLLTIYLCSHMYFKWYYWSAPAVVWCYFKEIMIRHTIEDSPDGQEVFASDECSDILTHFHAVYMTNLPLIHILTFGAHRLKFGWPFRAK